MKFTAVYIRVSSNPQSTRSQRPDLERWLGAYAGGGTKVKWFVDKASGKSMDRPGWCKLHQEVLNGNVSRLVVWRLDRLGRTASGLTRLFEELNRHRVKFISVKEGIDLSTPAGRLIANVLASVASYETEVGSERIRAGQAAARAAGKRWGGSKKGRLNTITREQAKTIIRMRAEGERIATIARATRVTKPSVYRILRRHEEGLLDLTG